MPGTRVVHLITNLWVGGAEMTLYRLLAHTDRQRFPSVVISLIDTGPVGRRIEALGVPVYSLGMKRTLPTPGELLALARIVRRERPDILQTWMYHADLLGLVTGALCGAGRIAWNLRCSDLPALGDSSRRTMGIVRACARLSRRPDAVVANAEAGRAFHEAVGYRPRRWEVIHNGIDLERFRPDEAARRETRAELGLPPDSLLIGHVGRFDPAKDQATFLRAAMRLHETHPHAHFLLAGRDVEPGNRALASVTAEHPVRAKLHLLGERDDVPRIMAALDLFACSSRSEGFPNVVGEAMACGVPVVTTDVGDARLLVGETGAIVPPGDPAAMAVAWQRPIDAGPEARQALGVAARARIQEQFSVERAVREYEALYASLSVGRGARRMDAGVVLGPASVWNPAPVESPAYTGNPASVGNRASVGNPATEVAAGTAGSPPSRTANPVAGPAQGRLLHITTVPMTLGFLTGQVGYMRERGFDVHCLSSPGPSLDRFAAREQVRVHAVEMPRRITLARDLVAVARIWRVLREVRPQVVHAHTPKGGLLGMIAATLAGTPVCIYHMHGLPLMTATGFKRQILRWTEKISCALAQRVLCVSHSIRGAAIAEDLCPPEKIAVLLGGSANGVDATGQFDPARHRDARQERRASCGIPEDGVVIGFVGRIVRDKGWVELARAWKALRREFPQLHLLAVGPMESQDPVPSEVAAMLRDDPRIHLTGEVDDTAPWYAAMDLLVLPSYREGLPYAPLEAASMALPVVATRIPGCTDAVVDGVTGTLVRCRDAAVLTAAIRRYVVDPGLRREHGTAGRERILREFRQEPIWEAVHGEYWRLMEGCSKTALTPSPSPNSGRGEPCSRENSPSPRIGRGGWGVRAPQPGSKRLLDLLGATFGLVVLAPVMLFVAAAVRVTMGRPVLFRQVRPGLHGRPFTMLKFRTMRDATDRDGKPLPDDRRLTRLGRLLRATSLDELPELFNVLKGEMSLVGPRPLLMEYLDRYTPEQARRHEVKPGITGWAQVNGRNAIDWEEKLRLDVWYVDHGTLGLDARILWQTLTKVVRRDGISADGHATMPVFLGTRERGR
jgi:glycosyltransferase involved in cell wall biosynthesis/lipopolysaccharide/colanic/teichoic acid biosynthesis glycosyltransferase